MTRFLTLLTAASLLASPALAAGFMFDLPTLSFPQTDAVQTDTVQTDAPLTQSTSGPVAPASVATPD